MITKKYEKKECYSLKSLLLLIFFFFFFFSLLSESKTYILVGKKCIDFSLSFDSLKDAF